MHPPQFSDNYLQTGLIRSKRSCSSLLYTGVNATWSYFHGKSTVCILALIWVEHSMLMSYVKITISKTSKEHLWRPALFLPPHNPKEDSLPAGPILTISPLGWIDPRPSLHYLLLESVWLPWEGTIFHSCCWSELPQDASAPFLLIFWAVAISRLLNQDVDQSL